MKIGIHRHSILIGALLIALALTIACLYAWGITSRIDEHWPSEGQIVWMLMVPALALPWSALIIAGFRYFWRGLTRYELREHELAIRRPLHGTRIISWESIQDFQLPPARFPHAPAYLVLILSNSPPVRLFIARFDAQHLDLLQKKIPGLAAWGFDRAKNAPPATLSVWVVRWRLQIIRLAPLYILFCVVLLIIFTGVVWAKNYLNFFRIEASPILVSGRITRIIHKSERDSEGDKTESVKANVEFVDRRNQKIRVERPVLIAFAKRFKIGNAVSVRYLSSDPHIARIPGWDMDTVDGFRLVVIGTFVVIVVALCRRLIFACFATLRERALFRSDEHAETVEFLNVDLALLSVLLPQMHDGMLILKPKDSGGERTDIDWAAKLERADIAFSARQKSLILEPTEARRLLNHLGGPDCYSDDYMVVDCDSADHVDASSKVRLRCINNKVSVLESAVRAELFQSWMENRLKRLYGGLTPAEFPPVDFAALLNIDAGRGHFHILIERGKSGPLVWLRVDGSASTLRATCNNCRWEVSADYRAPRVLHGK